MREYLKECKNCNISFTINSRNEASRKSKNKNYTNYFCSKECNYVFKRTKIKIKCSNCNKVTKKLPNQIKKSKSGNIFCSRSCSVTYNNKNKTKGSRRSKLETWIEKEVTRLYPNLIIDYNKKDVIGSELDIYIPSLKLAFELNGIFHYEPIYGEEKLNQIKYNDNSKLEKCQKLGISLCVIDTSQQKHFKEKNSQKYLGIITQIISQTMSLFPNEPRGG